MYLSIIILYLIERLFNVSCKRFLIFHEFQKNNFIFNFSSARNNSSDVYTKTHDKLSEQ